MREINSFIVQQPNKQGILPNIQYIILLTIPLYRAGLDSFAYFCLFVFLNTYMPGCACTHYVHSHVCMCVCVCVCVCVYVCVCVCVCISEGF